MTERPGADAVRSAVATGRLVLFGSGHEALGLSVLTVAVDALVTATIRPVSDPPRPPTALLAATLETLAAHGVVFAMNHEVVIEHAFKERFDLGNRAAQVVALLRLLLIGEDATQARLREPRRLAELAHEVLGVAATPAPRADTLTCALGGLHHLQFGPTPFVSTFAVPLGSIVVATLAEDEGLLDAEAALFERTAEVIADLREARPELDLERLAYDDAWNLLLDAPMGRCDAATRERLLFTVMQTRDLLLAAHQLLSIPSEFDAGRRAHLGELLDRDHVQRAEALRASAPRHAALRLALQATGALGVWRHGRTVAALAPTGESPAIAAAAALHGAETMTLLTSA
ncbi:MAG: hypothetical protein EXS13_01175 [Planctomycetes bacterium]|nr:hypothetical protein [Planctomycetota bacterium]